MRALSSFSADILEKLVGRGFWWMGLSLSAGSMGVLGKTRLECWVQ